MTQEILLPDTGSAGAVDVIEILVKPGESISKGQTILTLESDKATIDVPAPEAGIIEEVLVKVGSKIKSGDAIAKLKAGKAGATDSDEKTKKEEKPAAKVEKAASKTVEASKIVKPSEPAPAPAAAVATSEAFAGPAVRRLARLLGVNLDQISGSGDRGRITAEDVQNFVKRLITSGATTTSGSGLPTMPQIDFAQFGPIEVVALNRIKRLTAQNLSRNWLLAPHVTQFDEADITEMEVFRKSESARFEKLGFKLTPLVFIMKAVVAALKAFPQFNASLDHTGENLVYKKHYHIGIAVDTPEGLVVPVIRDADQKSMTEIAKELAEISSKAREKKLTAQDMQGSSFTISSLGGIGGTSFTPIINLPNVAILGVSKSLIKPQFDGAQFQPRLMLPLSLSYDHRVIDGAEAARFCVTITQFLADIRKLLL